MSDVGSQIQAVLTQSFAPQLLQVENESHNHNVPKGSESHFKVVLVSAAFEGISRIERHRRVQDFVSAKQFPTLHALTLKLYTPKEWQETNPEDLVSPPCFGGSKE